MVSKIASVTLSGLQVERYLAVASECEVVLMCEMNVCSLCMCVNCMFLSQAERYKPCVNGDLSFLWEPL